MTASALLDHLTERGTARPLPPRPGTTRAVAIGPIEVAESQRPSDTFMRARWKERVRGSAIPYLLIADDPQHPGRIRVLGPSHGNRPIQSVNAELLADSLQQLTELPAFDAIRRIADDLTRIGGDGLTVNGLLTRHTLEYRFKGDTARWKSATEEVRAVKPADSWQHVLRKLGYAVQQLPRRGYLARHQGRPVALIHPKGKARDLARVEFPGSSTRGSPPLGLRGSRGLNSGSGSRQSLPSVRCSFCLPASEWLELDIRLLGRRGSRAWPCWRPRPWPMAGSRPCETRPGTSASLSTSDWTAPFARTRFRRLRWVCRTGRGGAEWTSVTTGSGRNLSARR